jgi:hypothetical protein
VRVPYTNPPIVLLVLPFCLPPSPDLNRQLFDVDLVSYPVLCLLL